MVTGLLLLAACDRPATGGGRPATAPPAEAATADAAPGEDPAQPAGASTSVAQVEGITWFDQGIDAAFDKARAEDRLVFLYWGAEWCPPCYDLKAHVFPRADFQRSLRQFVPVYLDGDAPGAQRIAEQFRVQGYPSVVVLTADRRELARISGGSDLASYAEVLDLALRDTQPVEAILAQLEDPARRPDAAACRRLAWNDWSMWDGEQRALAEALHRAAQRCPAQASAERDRLLVQAADVASIAAAPDIAQGARPDATLVALVAGVQRLLEHPDRSLAAGNALVYLGEEFFTVARHAAPAGTDTLQQRYFALLDAVEADERQSATLRLLTAARRLQAAKALSGEGTVRPEVAMRARATLNRFLARDYDANARAGIVNSASWVLYELGDDLQLRALLEQQMKQSRTPYYYMPDLADIEERAGNTQAALQWLERGYRESRGPATRFQWGAQYLHGLLRMAPDDAARIRTATLQVLAELDGPERIHARARTRLQRLDEALKEWASDTGNAGTLADISAGWRKICAGLPGTDPARAGCAGLLG